MMISNYIEFSEEVKEAMAQNKPIVAIESAGTFEAFPYPQNMEVARMITDKIREIGAVPAYTAILQGIIHVGLSDQEAERIANPKEPLMKASRRDIPLLLSKKMDARTAVAAAMMIADLVGITVVTGGGIGGVHRGAATSFDISADLEEFVKDKVLVICSGAKSILDLKLTMEYMETHSVTIAGYKTKELPAYLAIHSGCSLDFSFDSPAEIAESFAIKTDLNLPGSYLIAKPIDEAYAVDSDLMNAAIEKAVKRAEENGIHGKIITKYILDVIKEEMGDDSTQASIHMNIANAELAAQVACLLVH